MQTYRQGRQLRKRSTAALAAVDDKYAVAACVSPSRISPLQSNILMKEVRSRSLYPLVADKYIKQFAGDYVMEKYIRSDGYDKYME